MTNKIDDTKDKQQRLVTPLNNLEVKLKNLEIQAARLPADKKVVVDRMLERQKSELLDAKNKLQEIDLNKKGTNTYLAVTETPLLIKKIKAIQDALQKMGDTMSRLLDQAPKNISTTPASPISNGSSSSAYTTLDWPEVPSTPITSPAQNTTPMASTPEKTKTEKLQARIPPLIVATEKRIEQLQEKIENSPEQSAGLKKQLQEYQNELSVLSRELQAITGEGVDANIAAQQTSSIIQKLAQMNHALNGVSQIIEKLFTKKTIATEPTLNEKNTDSNTNASSVGYDTANWPEAPSNTATAISKNATPSVQREDKDKNRYQKNQELMQQGHDLLENKEAGITKRYKEELHKLDKTLNQADKVLPDSHAFGKDDIDPDEVENEIRKHLPK